MKSWNPELDLHTDSIKSLPLWTRLLDLDLKYWGMSGLSKIASVTGTPLKTNRSTKEQSMIKYARILIELPIEGLFLEFIEFFNEENILNRQTVSYEWLPTKCSHCGMFGHEDSNYRNKGAIRKEWRRVIPPADEAVTNNTAPPVTDVEGYVPVARHSSARRTGGVQSPQPQPILLQSPEVRSHNSNSFQLLAVQPVVQMHPSEAPSTSNG